MTPDIRLAVGLVDECVSPSGVLRGEVIVVVHSSCVGGIPYRRIRLQLKGVEHNRISDDQGEFDPLLNGYTADRVYLQRHVTLSGKAKSSEDEELFIQSKQEAKFRENHCAPYCCVSPMQQLFQRDQKAAAEAAFAQLQNDADLLMATPEAQMHLGSIGSSIEHFVLQQLPTKPAPPLPSDSTPEDNDSPLGGAHHRNAGTDSQADMSLQSTTAAGLEPSGSEELSSAPQNTTAPHPMAQVSGSTPSKGAALGPITHAVPASAQPATSNPAFSAEKEIWLDQEPLDPTSSVTSDVMAHLVGGRGAPEVTQTLPPAPISPPAFSMPSPATNPPEAESTGPELRLHPGRYTFPFQFRVPPWMPPSLYYEIPSASGSISYSAKATVHFGGGSRLVSEKRFFVVSTVSKRQLLLKQEEAVRWMTVAPIAPLSVQYQVFKCSCLGNLCCLRQGSSIEVEVSLLSSRAYVLADANAVYQALRGRRDDSAEGHAQHQEEQRKRYNTAAKDHPAEVFYDWFASRQPQQQTTGDAYRNATAFHRRDEIPDDHLPTLCSADVDAPLMNLTEEQLQEMLEVEKALPLPVGMLPLAVRVVNRCVNEEISRVRVELRESVQIFKALGIPYVLPHPLASFDYTVSIPPGQEVIFQARMILPSQFRRCEGDDEKLVPPPGVRTANIRTASLIQVSFPDLCTYVEEEDWATDVILLAEAVDMMDNVLSLPVRYS